MCLVRACVPVAAFDDMFPFYDQHGAFMGRTPEIPNKRNIDQNAVTSDASSAYRLAGKR